MMTRSPPNDTPSNGWPDGLYSVKQHGVTIANCESEPVQTPGGVQGHGVLFVVRRSDLEIMQVSESSPTLLGMGVDVLLRVTDEGIGIPAKDGAKVFDWFSRARNARRIGISGVGIGLAGVRNIVELHGETISVESVAGEGSTFTVRLPPRLPHALAFLTEESSQRAPS